MQRDPWDEEAREDELRHFGERPSQRYALPPLKRVWTTREERGLTEIEWSVGPVEVIHHKEWNKWGARCVGCRGWAVGYMSDREAVLLTAKAHATHMHEDPSRWPGL